MNESAAGHRCSADLAELCCRCRCWCFFAFQITQTCSYRMLRSHMQRSLRLQSAIAVWGQPTVTLLQQNHCMRIDVEGTEQSWLSAHLRRTCGQGYSSSAMVCVCWQCRNELKEVSMFFCAHCKSILPPAAQPDLFKVMGL